MRKCSENKWKERGRGGEEVEGGVWMEERDGEREGEVELGSGLERK